jgi:3-dehydroquinate synthase
VTAPSRQRPTTILVGTCAWPRARRFAPGCRRSAPRTLEDRLIDATPISRRPTSVSEGLFAWEHGDGLEWRVNAHKLVSYDVKLSPDLLNPDNPTLASAGATDDTRGHRRLIVLETTVHGLFGAQIAHYLDAHAVTYEFCIIDAHETVKTMDSVFRVVSSMDAFGVPRRREPVVAIGGGVLTDIVGLATSLYRRSTPYVRVPTTLIGMVDAGIGAKTGVNFEEHKNRLGTYHPSAVTLIDPSFLVTLPARHLRNGLAEMLKIAMVKDPELFEILAGHGARLVTEKLQRTASVDAGAQAIEAIRLSIHGMLAELQPNLWEHQLARLVDFGHSFSPTIEMRALPELLHGEAVCIDMALSSIIAHNRGLIGGDDLARIRRVIADLGLPTWHRVCSPEVLWAALTDTVRHRDGRQLLPLPNGLGRACFVDDVTSTEIWDAAVVLRNWSAGASGMVLASSATGDVDG